MKINSSNLKKCILTAVITTLFMVLPSIAQENVIQSVTISKAKDKVNAYDLSIDSNRQVSYKSYTDEEGSIYFDLKNSVVAPNLDTFYDDAAEIDNVIVKQADRSRVRIYVKGKNAQNTELSFANSILDNNPKKIVLNRPMAEYQSTNLNDLENAQGDEQAWDDNSFNLAHLGASLFATLKDTGIGLVLVFLAVISIVVLLLKNLSARLSQDKEPLIGLNTTRFNEDITFEQVLPQAHRRSEGMDYERRQEALKLAQAQLAQAHEKYQTYLHNKYNNANFQNKPKSIGIDPIKQGIALNQYQKSTQNPYSDQEVLRMDEAQNYSQDDFKIPARPQINQFKKQVTKPDFTTSTVNTSPYIQRKSNTFGEKKENTMKFLESVTKIYEQSGRADLANGLKNTISKTKQTI